jgi:hypothetical protein
MVRTTITKGIDMLLTIKKAKELVGNKIFTVEFVKLNGEVRKMTARLGVKKHLKGGTMTYDPIERNLLPVFDMTKQEYRMINFDSIIYLKVDGIIYENTGSK